MKRDMIVVGAFTPLIEIRSRTKERVMPLNAVKLPITAPVPMDCIFWPEDDSWKGACEELSIFVSGGSFEEAKKKMEATLQSSIRFFLRDRTMAA